MKTKHREGKPKVAPLPVDNSNLTSSYNDKNNNRRLDSLAEKLDKLSITSRNSEPKTTNNIVVCVKNNIETSDKERQNGNSERTEELIKKLAEIEIVDRVHSVPNERQEVDNKSKVASQEESQSEDDLCSRGPAKHGYREEQRFKTNPYLIQGSYRNRTTGGVVFVETPSLGPTEETVNIDQLAQTVLDGLGMPSSPSFIYEDVTSIDDIGLKDINEVVNNPELLGHMFAAFSEGSESSGYGESISSAEMNILSSPEYSLTSPEQSYLGTSPQLYPASPNQFQSQQSPYQVVPSQNMWQESTFIHTPSISPSSSSNPISPPEVPSMDSPCSGYSGDSEYSLTFRNNYTMNNIIDSTSSNNNNLNKKNNTQGSFLRAQPVYTPILSPSPVQLPTTLSLDQLPTTLSLDQLPTTITSQIPMSSSGLYPCNVQATTSPNNTPSQTTQGYTQNILSLSPQISYGRQQTTTNIVIQMIEPTQQSSPKQVQSQTRPRPRPIAPKPPNIPSKDDLLLLMDRKKKKDAWFRVNMKSKEDLVKGDKDGDTLLMIVVSQERDSLLELVYAFVEYMRRCVPDALNKKNNHNQTALYNACISLPKYPIVARYLAETLLSLGVNIAEDKFQDGQTLVECVRRKGVTHSAVLNVLLNLKTVNGTAVFSQ